MAARLAFAAGLFALAASDYSIQAIFPSASAAAFGQRLVPERSVPERSVPERSVPERSVPERSVPERSVPARWARVHTPPSRGPASRAIERWAAQPKRPREDSAFGLIRGRWCDDRGERWFFQREIVVHDMHVHRARYERRKTSIVVMVDGYPDTFSRFTPDGLRMTLLSSALDPDLKMRRFTRCPELLSALGSRGRVVR